MRIQQSIQVSKPSPEFGRNPFWGTFMLMIDMNQSSSEEENQ